MTDLNNNQAQFQLVSSSIDQPNNTVNDSNLQNELANSRVNQLETSNAQPSLQNQNKFKINQKDQIVLDYLKRMMYERNKFLLICRLAISS